MQESQVVAKDVPAQSHNALGSDHESRIRPLAIARAFATVGLMILLVIQPTHSWGVVFEVAFAACLLASILWAASRPSKLKREITRLTKMVADVRQGREPNEHLSGFNAPLTPLAELYQELLRDIRQERVRITELQEEIRQRIASRTQSLERTIGALRQQAAKDGLTGLFNRRMLDAYLPDAIERCKVSSVSLCLLMIDIDHFKPLNDTLGHAAGDQMLKSVAQIIRSTIRESDLAFRNGGDEFVVVLEGCKLDAARALADRLNSLGHALGRTFRLNPPPTLSVGLTSLAQVKEATAAALLRVADEALYEIKAAHHAAVSAPPPRSRRTG